jgi:hypothetical protein
MLNETQQKKLATEAARHLDLINAGTWRTEEIKAFLKEVAALDESASKPKRKDLKAERAAQFTDKGWRKPIENKPKKKASPEPDLKTFYRRRGII